MENLIPWGLTVVRWVQSFRNPFLDSIFSTINYLGDANFLLALVPLLYWCVHKQIGYRLAVLLGISTFTNLFLKDLLAQPRPYHVDPNIWLIAEESSYGIPSFHAQSTILTYGYLASQFGQSAKRAYKILLWTLAITILLLVSIGRMYVGVHFPHDLIVGAAIGIALLIVYTLYEPRVGEWIKTRWSLTAKLAVAIAVPLALSVTDFTLDTGRTLGTLLGFITGLTLQEEFLRFDARTEIWKQVIKIIVGLSILIGLQQGLKIFLPEAPLNNFVRYSVVALWLGLGAPWVFVRARLAKTTSPNERAAV